MSNFLKPRQVVLVKLWYKLFGLFIFYKRLNLDFMNLGYVSQSDLDYPCEGNDREGLRYRQICLYLKVLGNWVLPYQSVLEVGCGLGGGAYVLNKYIGVKSFTGIDITKHFIKACQRKFIGVKQFSFVEGSYESIKVARDKIDVVICLETSSHFKSREDFFRRISATLNVSGTFLFADILSAEEVIVVEEHLHKYFVVLERENLTDGVLHSIAKTSTQKGAFKLIEWLVLDIGGVNFTPGSAFHKALQEGALVYMRYACRTKS